MVWTGWLAPTSITVSSTATTSPGVVASTPMVMVSLSTTGASFGASPARVSAAAGAGACGAGASAAGAGEAGLGVLVADSVRGVGPESPRPHTGHAPLPWPARTFSAMAICWSRVARWADEANWPPP